MDHGVMELGAIFSTRALTDSACLVVFPWLWVGDQAGDLPLYGQNDAYHPVGANHCMISLRLPYALVGLLHPMQRKLEGAPLIADNGYGCFQVLRLLGCFDLGHQVELFSESCLFIAASA